VELRSDADWSAALVREAEEESQVRIDPGSVRYLGHQVVTGDPAAPAPYVQVRLFALIEGFDPHAPDPDSGHTYGRLLTSFRRAAELLEWGELGELQAAAAARAAKDLGLPVGDQVEEAYAW
jgi:8-oxo-dGTP pyrophosphatase MutT (NUDIX family)